MQIIKRNVPNAGYEQFDAVAIVEDGHQWSPLELGGNFLIETNATLTDSEKGRLLMPDETVKSNIAVSQIPTFRGQALGSSNLNQLHRRKYQHNNSTVELKANAQGI